MSNPWGISRRLLGCQQDCMAAALLDAVLGFVLIAGILGGTGYAVFVLGHSGWWLLAAVWLSSVVRPTQPCPCGERHNEEERDG